MTLLHTGLNRIVSGFVPGCLAASMVLGLSGCQTPSTAQLPSGPEQAFIVQLRANADARQLLGRGLTPLWPEKRLYRLEAQGDAQNLQRQLQQLPQVHHAEQELSYALPEVNAHSAPPLLSDFSLQAFRPNDVDFDFQWNMSAIQMEEAWKLSRGSREVTVAVIDSGVDPEHPELKDVLLPLEDVWGELGGSDILVGRRSKTVLNFKGRDGNGHGTHVAGVIGAMLNNREGVAGIAGGGVKILPVKVTNLLGTTNSTLLVEGIRRAVAQNVDVINLSIGTLGGDNPDLSTVLKDVVDDATAKGIVVVAATGNESERQSQRISGVSFPAAYDNVIAVGASNSQQRVAHYSNGGPQIDLLAPGGEGDLERGGTPILSTWPTYASFEYLRRRVRTLNYATASGTSMAAPHVSGVVALLLSQQPELSPQQVRSRLVATADDILQPGFDNDSGYGLLNAYRALKATGDDAQF